MIYNWSLEELQAVDYYAKKSLPKLRRIQTVIEHQTQIAYNRRIDSALWRLQRLNLIVAAAVDRKEFGD